MIDFCITSYFDPYGDKKSNRKLFKREFYRSSSKLRYELEEIVYNHNNKVEYYDQIRISFPRKSYKIEPINFDNRNYF